MKLHELTIDPLPEVEKDTITQGGTISITSGGVRKVYSMDEYFKQKALNSQHREQSVDDHLGAVGD